MQNSTKPPTDRERRQSRFWWWSLGLHTVGLTALVVLTPVREVIFDGKQQKKPEITMSGEQLKDVIEKIRTSEEDELRERVALLGMGVDRIRVNLLNKQRNNQGFENAQRAAAFDRIQQSLVAAIAAQGAKIPLHHKNIGRTYDPDDAMEIQRQDTIARNQQDDIEAALPLLPDQEGLTALIAQQKEASDAQSTAANFSRRTQDAANSVVRYEREQAKWQEEVSKLTDKVSELTATVAELQTAVPAAETAFTDAEAAYAASEEVVKISDAAYRAAANDDDKNAAKETLNQTRSTRETAKKLRDEARRARDVAKRDLTNAERSLDRDTNTLKDHQGRLDEATSKLTKATTERNKKDEECTWHAKHAQNTQQAVLDQFLASYNAESVATSLAQTAASATPTTALITAPDVPSVEYAILRAAKLADLFDISDYMIAQAVTDYRGIKAIELARLRDLALLTALEQISPLTPLPTKVNTDLLRADITDPDLVEPHKQEILKVKSSVEEKIALVEQLLKDLEQQEMSQLADAPTWEKSLEDMVSEQTFDETAQQEELASQLMEQLSYEEQRELQNSHLEALAAVAQEDLKERMKDLTALMKKNPLSGESAEAAETAEAAEAAAPTKPSTTTTKPLEMGATPPLNLKPDTPATLARKITDTGSPSEWMYIDTWYTIGPFGNEGRRNLNTKFPPETVVNLDAQYVGKSGRTVRWSFVQSRGPMVIPADDVEYAIYYGYTEIFSDRPRDVWVAVGSDDKANIWINDMPIWISDDKLKGWNITEGYRKVHLKQGVNKVLYRIENGWRGTAFSMAVHTKRQD